MIHWGSFSILMSFIHSFKLTHQKWSLFLWWEFNYLLVLYWFFGFWSHIFSLFFDAGLYGGSGSWEYFMIQRFHSTFVYLENFHGGIGTGWPVGRSVLDLCYVPFLGLDLFGYWLWIDCVVTPLSRLLSKEKWGVLFKIETWERIKMDHWGVLLLLIHRVYGIFKINYWWLYIWVCRTLSWWPRRRCFISQLDLIS